MKNNRPVLKVPYETIDLILDVLCITLLVIMWGYVITTYGELPDEIPTHFNGKGEVDGHGKKTFIWSLPAISTFTFLLMFVLNKFPHLHNYMTNITEDNALKNYKLSTRFVRFINAVVLLIFAYITYTVSRTHVDGVDPLGVWFVPITLLVVFIPIIIYFIEFRKINKQPA